MVRHFGSATTSRRNAQEYTRGNPVADAALDHSHPSFTAPLVLVDREPVEVDEVYPRERSEIVARAVNVAVATVLLIVFAIPMMVVALIVRLTSKGPVMYSQVRVGVDRRFPFKSSHGRRVYDHGGRLFTMYKFRTMQVNAEADGKAVWAQKSDPRTTSVGKYMRRFRIDELPQLYNVLRGDMNIVGPRPERPSIFAQLRVSVPQYHQRQRVKPGITGWAQINQAYDECLDDVKTKVRFDLEYVQRQSLVEDLRIMSMTLPVMLFRRGGW